MTVEGLIRILSSEWNKDDIVLAYDRTVDRYVPADHTVALGRFTAIMPPNDTLYVEDLDDLPKPAKA